MVAATSLNLTRYAVRLEPARQLKGVRCRAALQRRPPRSDLAKPHHSRFYLHFPSWEAAHAAPGSARRIGLSLVRVDKAADGQGWLLLLSNRLLPTADAMARISSQLRATAKSGKGVYNGREAEIVR
jgi:hypothetical protein